MTTEQLRLPLLPASDPDVEHEPRRSTPDGSASLSRERAAPSPPEIFRRVFQRMELKRPLPQFQVEFRAYAGLRSTIQANHGRLQVWISDLLADAPPIVLEALAEILLAKLFRRRPSREARECYLAHIYKESTRSRIEEVRRMRGYKRQRPPRGRCFDLDEIFSSLNRRFFHEQLTRPIIGWSAKRSRTILGHYDSAHASITISRWLDSPAIPRYLVEYIMFHEMLHMKYPVERNGNRRLVHSREFHKAEKRFPDYERARRRLKRLCGQPLEGRE